MISIIVLTINVAVAALVKIENDVLVAPLFQKALELGIGGLKEFVEIFHAQVQLGTDRRDLVLHRRDMSFQKFDSVPAGIVENQKALHLNQTEPLHRTLRVHRLYGTLEFLYENQRRTRRTALVATAPSEAINDRKTKPFTLR